MKLIDRIHHDEFPTVRAEFEAAHPPKPTDVFRPVPGGRRAPDVLAELRIEAATICANPDCSQPKRHSGLCDGEGPLPVTPHHMPADLVPLPLMRTVPLVEPHRDDIDTVLADLATIHAAHPAAGNALLDVPGALDTLAEIRMLLGGAK